MKKIIIAFILVFGYSTSAFAATFFSQQYNSFYMNQTRELWPINITATADGEIGPDKGINLFFDVVHSKMLWDKVATISASGTAVTNGKISAVITPEYLNGYQILHIPVIGSFTAGETVVFTGIKMRAYQNSFISVYLQLDTNGDLVSDAEDSARIEVVAITPATDITPPYPPVEFNATLSTDLKTVTLTWLPSPDFDLKGMTLDRFLSRNGNLFNANLADRTSLYSYVDTDFQLGDTITYRLSGSDGANLSTPIEKIIEIKAVSQPPVQPVQPPTQPPVQPPTQPPVSDESTELDQLSNLFNYYKVRYSIKCMRNGVPALKNDSVCLWARIDMVYAQEMLSRNEVNTAISDYDKELMSKRVKYPEARYQTNCVEAETPASYCPALEKALQRIYYFIEQ